MAPLLQIENLTVRFDGPDGPVRAVDGLSLSVERGETYALVGESGSGKSTVGFAAMRLAEPGIIEGGRVLLDGRDLMTLAEKEMCRLVKDAGAKLFLGVGANAPLVAASVLMVIGLAMIVNLFAAALAGILIPLGLEALDLDPAVASSVFVTTVTDVVGFFAFLGLAALWLA